MNKATKQLLEENNRRGEQLTPENQKILVDIVAYLRGSSASTYQQELVHRDILDMLQEGEARGQTAPQVIGEDYQTFCDEILAELQHETTHRLRSEYCQSLRRRTSLYSTGIFSCRSPFPEPCLHSMVSDDVGTAFGRYHAHLLFLQLGGAHLPQFL